MPNVQRIHAAIVNRKNDHDPVNSRRVATHTWTPVTTKTPNRSAAKRPNAMFHQLLIDRARLVLE